MKIPQATAEKVMTGSMQNLWDTFINLEGEYDGFEEDYELIRYGISVKFEIYDLWEDTKQIIRKDKDEMVIVKGKQYKLEAFRTEKEERRRMMANAIIENTEEKEVLHPR